MRSSVLACIGLLASFTVFGAGCAASADGSEPEADGSAALSTASSTSSLSQALVCAAVSAAENNTQGEGLKSLEEAKLKGAALHDFKSWQRNMLPDYPSVAYELPVKLGTKTYTFVMVTENNDGGGAIGVYRTDGSVVTTDEYSESEENPWSAPGDTCPDPQ